MDRLTCGHARKMHALGLCKSCHMADLRRRRKEGGAVRGMRQRAACHPERKHFARGECSRCYHKKYARQTYRASGWVAHLRAKYGITPERLAELAKAQKLACAVCGVMSALHVDHDHSTGRVRGLLCGSCNRGIGLFNDDPTRLRLAADYLAGCP